MHYLPSYVHATSHENNSVRDALDVRDNHTRCEVAQLKVITSKLQLEACDVLEGPP